MRKLTVGIFVDSFFPMVDGVAMVVDNYAKRLAKEVNVIVFCPKYLDKETDDSIYNYKVVRCFSAKIPFVDYNFPTPKLDLKFERKLNKYHLDIIHIHSPFAIGKLGIEYAKKHNIPLVGTMHSQYKQDFIRAFKSKRVVSLMIKELVRRYDTCDRYFTVNKEVARIYHEEYGCSRLPEIINNATDMTLIKDKKSADNYINNLYNIKSDDKVLLFVGRINALKNIFLIADALKILKRKKFNYKMLFVGTGQDEKELKERISSYGLDDNVIFCGAVNNREKLKNYYRRADLFLFPSLYDTNSLVQIEASSQKLPGLFLGEAATAATISDNVTGFLSKSDASSYANRIIEIFDNEKLYDEVRENVYKYIYVTWDAVSQKLLNIYRELIKEKELEK